MKQDQVVITGMALTTSVGATLKDVFNACLSGASNFVELDTDVGPRLPMRFAGVCQKLDVKSLPDRKIQKATTRKDIIGVITALNAAKDAGLEPGLVNPERFAMYTGCSCTQIQDLRPYFALLQDSIREGRFDSEQFGAKLMGSVNPMVMMQTLMNNVLCYTSIAFDIRGVNANFTDFQMAGMQALAAGFAAIEDGRADVALVGGVAGEPDAFFAKDGVAMGYLADTSDPKCDPAKVVAPFDEDRMGTILAEGSGFIVLESRKHAVARKARIYGTLDAVKVASDAGFYHESQTTSRGLELAISQARESVKAANQIVVFSGANGAKDGDRIEGATLVKCLGKGISSSQVCSVKPIVGEMSEASGVLNLILALTALNEAKLPPIANLVTPEPQSAALNLTRQEDLPQSHRALVPVRSVAGLCAAAIVSKV